VFSASELEHFVRKWSQKAFSGYPVLWGLATVIGVRGDHARDRQRRGGFML
jgi:hypothetical protein